MVQKRAARIALGTLVPKNQLLSLEMVQQIVSETRAKRELSQPEIGRLTWTLNLTLSEYERRKELSSELTFQQLCAQVGALRKALRKAVKKLKLALPCAEQTSLRNYLIDLGETYAARRKGHPNLDPHTVSGLLSIDEEVYDEVTAEVHYRSDEKLDQIVGDVTYLLDWMDHTPAHMKRPSNWWDRAPFWLEDRTVEEDLERSPFERIDVHKSGHSKVWLIGWDLPKVYHSTFGQPYRVSRTFRSGKYGPGVRFVLSVSSIRRNKRGT